MTKSPNSSTQIYNKYSSFLKQTEKFKKIKLIVVHKLSIQTDTDTNFI